MKNINSSNFWYRIGVPTEFTWGYIGTFLFMLGSCIENSWFSAYLVDLGFSVSQAATIFSAFGIMVALGSWLSGICVEVWGAKKIMLIGLIAYLAFSIPFMLFALPSENYLAILLLYMGRGLGYPLFCYSFLVWLTIDVDVSIQGRATSYFWICYNLGFTIIGPVFAVQLIPFIGETAVIWVGIVLSIVGSLLALFLTKKKFIIKERDTTPLVEIKEGILIMFKRPRIGTAVIVKTINGLGTYDFVVVLPVFLINKGYSMAEWSTIWGATFISNQIFNVIFGYLGDKIGFRKTIQLFGGTLTGVATIAVYLVPQLFGYNYWLFFLAMCFWGAGLAGFVPMSPLVPLMAPDNKGAANSAVNFGSGLGNFVGPALVSFLVVFGTGAVMYTMAALYLISVILTAFLKTPDELHQPLKDEAA